MLARKAKNQHYTWTGFSTIPAALQSFFVWKTNIEPIGFNFDAIFFYCWVGQGFDWESGSFDDSNESEWLLQSTFF